MKTRIPIDLIRFGTTSVWMNIAGILLSGLIFPVLSALFYPQPAWQGSELFIKSFHPLQTFTFFCGFFLVIGSLLTFITLYLMSDEGRKPQALAGLIINTVFTAVIFLNYIIQTTYIPYLATQNPPETSSIMPVFTMANPGSFAWALEMYGWGGIGLSYFFMAALFDEGRLPRTLKTLFRLNGISSCASAIITSVNMNWLFSPAGFASLIIWNLLVLVIDICLLKYFAGIRHPAVASAS